jgi:Sec-independent protein secretion pathway component TatC
LFSKQEVQIPQTQTVSLLPPLSNTKPAGFEEPMLEPLLVTVSQSYANLDENLLPKSVKLIQITPQGAFVTQIYVSGLLGVILAIPIVVREVVGFVGPGLYQSEKAIIKKATLPSIVLFTIGLLIFLLYCYTIYGRFLVQIWRGNWG